MKYSLIGIFLQCMFLSLLVASNSEAQKYQSVKEIYISVQLEDASLQETFNWINNNTELNLNYDNIHIKDLDTKINYKKSNASIEKLLLHISKKAKLKFKQVNNNISVDFIDESKNESKIEVIIQGITITGNVTSSEDSEGLPGVNVVVKGTSVGTVTDVEGNYKLEVPDENTILVISSVGYVQEEIVVGNQSVINMSMVPDITALEEIVVVGYGTQKKVNLTGAVDVISGDVVANRPAANVSLLLQGASPNLNISLSRNGGEPGADQNWQIRGAGSLAGNSKPLILVDGVEMDPNLLDPESIESVSILKDASASAVYGSRAAFGVVLITTKQGKKNQPLQVQYSNNISITQPIYVPSMVDSYTMAIAFNQARSNAGLGPKFPDEQVDRIKGYIDGTYPNEYDYDNPPNSIWRGRHMGNANNDWLRKFYKPSVIYQKHNVNLSGGTEKSQYYFNAGYFDQPASYSWGGGGFKRYNIVTNFTSDVTDWLSFNFGMKYARSETDNPIGGVGRDRTWLWGSILNTWPTAPEFNEDGSYANPAQMAMMTGGRVIEENHDLWTNIGFELEPVKGWKTNVKYRYNNRWGSEDQNPIPVIVTVPSGNDGNIGSRDSGFRTTLNQGQYSLFSAYSSYEKEAGKHFFKALVGYEQEENLNRDLTGFRQDLITTNIPSISTAVGSNITLDDNMSHWATQGVFGRLNYNYAGKYLVEVSARNDGSSRFKEGSRWGFFPSVSAGYNIAQENFWSSIEPIVNTLKIRGSYGSLGNQRFSDDLDNLNSLYVSLPTIPIAFRETKNAFEQGYLVDNGIPLYAEAANLVTSNLTWETITTLNIGIDATFLKNRLGLTADWYDRVTSDMLGPAEILPSVLGADIPESNNAKLSTKGIEVSLSWKDRISSDLSYNARVSFGDNQTTILEYKNEDGFVDDWYVGKKMGEIWGLTTDGIIQTQEEADAMADQSLYFPTWGPGDIKYKDLNGDGVIDEGNRTLDDRGDLTVIGNATVRFNYNFSLGVQWKNFDFNMFWQGIGRRNLMPDESSELYYGLIEHPNSSILLKDGPGLDYWRPADETNILGPNTDSFLPKPYFTTETWKNRQYQTRYLMNAAYLRLKNLQIGYTIPKSISQKIFIQNARIYFSGENLLTITGMAKLFEPETLTSLDPNRPWDLGQIYPISRAFSFGLNVTF